MRLNSATYVRLVLLILFVALIGAFVAAQYDTVRDTVRFICVDCIGLGG